jgi:hypothetical protein
MRKIKTVPLRAVHEEKERREREERYTPAVYEYIVAPIHRVVRRAYHNTYYGTSTY